MGSLFSTERDTSGGSVSKESARKAGDPGLIPGSGRSPREGNGNPFKGSWPGDHMDRGQRSLAGCGVTRVGHNLATTPPVS